MKRILGLLLAAVAAPIFMAPAAAQAADAAGYSLAPTVSTTVLTAESCADDPLCLPAPEPAGNGADDRTALMAVVAKAGALATTGAPATVFLRPGVYTLAKPLKLLPNVNLRGSGITATTLVTAPDSFANFSYSFLVRPDDAAAPVDGSTSLVSDLTVNGNCKAGAGLTTDRVPPATSCDHGASTNSGGGIKAGDRWTIQHVRFTNLEYFKLWINGTTGVRVIDNRWDNLGGAGSGDEDNIGGGGFATDTVVSDNQFDGTMLGNSLDVVNMSGLVFQRNTVFTDPAMLTRFNREDNGTVYFEAVTDSEIRDNTFYGGHIVLKSNAGYSHTGNNKNVTNPKGILVRNNTIIGSYGSGITVGYTDYTDPDGSLGTGNVATDPNDPSTHTLWTGGNNVIQDNTIDRPADAGILVFGCYDAAKTRPDTITGNVVRDAGRRSSTVSTGCGTFDAVGIGLSIGRGDKVYGNSVTDSAAAKGTWYGVQLGSRTAKTTLSNTDLSGGDNTSTGVVVGAYRYGVGSPETPVGDTASRTGGSATLTWRESTALSGIPVGGYRVYRNGTLIADLPAGSTPVPGNLLSDNGTGWTAGTKSTTVTPKNGILTVAATAAGTASAQGPVTTVTPGKTYTATASFKSDNVGRRVRTGLVWLDANGTAVSSKLYTSNTATSDSADGWITSTFAAQAPVNAVSARVLTVVEGVSAGEIHYQGRLGLSAGTSTQSFDDAGAPSSGAVSYQVVAYRTGGVSGSELSSPAVLTLS
ncbi:right-handed parallel beta-helix repeat-containing protein [Symbioplanes lichenis]|uniref:right-handed parallel beta-helix repeat-containing protein n=1 Tax=Symbioplanes lichenis TaxID=1629072 RepID=UPI002739DE07|nr:right-handed parallel beta-helix repeat-containing protein [Actinoplanes lichenis]